MTKDLQVRAMELLKEVCELSGDIRFGQLLAHLCFLADDSADGGAGEIEDARMIEVLARHRDELRERLRIVRSANTLPSLEIPLPGQAQASNPN